MIRSLLNRLAARILRGQIRGIVIGSPTECDPAGVIPGWIYGANWHIILSDSRGTPITFAGTNRGPVRPLGANVIQLGKSSLDEARS